MTKLKLIECEAGTLIAESIWGLLRAACLADMLSWLLCIFRLVPGKMCAKGPAVQLLCFVENIGRALAVHSALAKPVGVRLA